MALLRSASTVVTILFAYQLWASARTAAWAAEADRIRWHSDYRQAWQLAEQQGRMLLILFRPAHSPLADEVERRITSQLSQQHRSAAFVLARLPERCTIRIEGKRTRVLRHAAFREMHGRAGLAIIDLKHRGAEYFGHVVSAFPFVQGSYYRFSLQHLPAMLNLPAGTITQRTMIWAVRTHPDRPASTRGGHDRHLAHAASEHSRYQARLGRQGHHRWGSRFQVLRRLLGFRYAPVEVVAESWPGQTMIDACVDCVASWRQSSGHWRAVKSAHGLYAYDIKQGTNGIWYGTGIFAGFSSTN